MPEHGPSLYELLLQNFSGELPLEQVREQDQELLSVLDNLQRLFNSRAGTLSHLPDYGIANLELVLQGVTGAAHGMVEQMQGMLLRYEPRLAAVAIRLLPPTQAGHLDYALDVQLKGGELATFGTALAPEGRVLLRHLTQQYRVPR
jgi:type VI secretion system protein